jgi:hypothetical protein
MINGQYTLIDDLGITELRQPTRTEFSYNPYDGSYGNNKYPPSYNMSYPGILEQEPAPTLQLKQAQYASDFANNKYQQNPYRGYNPNDNNCVSVHEHFKNCEVCSKLNSLNSKVYIIIIICLLILIIGLLSRKGHKK